MNFFLSFLIIISSVLFHQDLHAQVDTCFSILSVQKISDIEGSFTASFNNNDRFESVCNLGDFNGDGINDILAGAKWDDDGGTDKGAVYILYMNGNATVNNFSKISDTQGSFGGLSSVEVFGAAVDTIGDLNNDGVMDIVVGASEYGGGVGAIHVLFLNSNGTVQNSVRIADGMGGFPFGIISGNAEFGFSVSCLNDLNGDGNNDLLVGSFNLSDGGAGRGAVFILFLNSNGTVQSYNKISSTSGGFLGVLDNGDGFGMVEDLGDYNNDGIRDIAVGTIRDDDGGIDKGAVWILSIDNTGNVVSSTKISDTQGGFSGVLGVNDEFGWSVSDVGDLDGDGVGDILVGVIEDDDGGVNKGAAYLLFLNTNGSVRQYFKISDLTANFANYLDNTDWFGLKTSSIGDFDGNGVVDIIVSAGLDDDGGSNRGAFYIIFLENNCNNKYCNLASNFSFSNICLSDSVNFTDLSIDSIGNIINWQWYFGDGDSIIGVQNPSHLYNSPGNYDVKLLITNDLNCIDSVTIPLTINPIFSSTQNQTICEGDSTLFGGIYYDSTGIYTDNLQTVLGCDSLLVFDLIVNPAYQINQTQTICQGDSILIGGLFQSLTGVYVDRLQSVSGCDSILSTTLTLDSIPDVIASDDINVISCSSTQLSVSGASTYTWSPSAGLSCFSCPAPDASPLETTTYVVTGFINGCSSKDSIKVGVEEVSELIIPNVFSPNNDGVNDGFNLIGGCIETIDKKVFNRWGEMLFHSNQINEVWNGRSTSGEEVSDGTYFYVFDVMHFQGGKEVLKTYRGTVSLFR